MLQVGMSNMSDRVALDGRSTCDEHMCDRNMCKLFLNHVQARLVPKLPVFESRCMCERSRKRSILAITHNDQTTYQTIHFKHNNSIGSLPELCIFPHLFALHFICITFGLHLHYICISHSPWNRYICITFD